MSAHHDNLTCSVVNANQGHVYRWEYKTNPDNIIVKDSGIVEWSGPVVISGEVKLTYKWGSNGANGTRTKVITISRRTSGWKWDQTTNLLTRPAGGSADIDACFAYVPEPHRVMGQIAANECSISTFGHAFNIAPALLDINNGFTLDLADTRGPNAGLYYSETTNLYIDQRWAISPWLRPTSLGPTYPIVNGDLGSYKCGVTSGSSSIVRLNLDCHAMWSENLPQVWDLITEHEAEHGRIMRVVALRSPSMDVLKNWEAMVDMSNANLRARMRALAVSVDATIISETMMLDDQSPTHPSSREVMVFTHPFSSFGNQPFTWQLMSLKIPLQSQYNHSQP